MDRGPGSVDVNPIWGWECKDNLALWTETILYLLASGQEDISFVHLFNSIGMV